MIRWPETLLLGAGCLLACGRIDYAPSDCVWGPFEPPTLLTKLSTAGHDYSPSMAPGGLHLAFSSSVTGKQTIYIADRTSVSEAFDNAVAQPALSEDDEEALDPALGLGALEMFYTFRSNDELSMRRTTRPSTDEPFSTSEEVLPASTGEFYSPRGPHLSHDTRTLFFSAHERGSNQSILWRMERPSRAAAFGEASVIARNDDLALAWPTVSADELEAFVEAGVSVGDRNADIWRATRSSRDEQFSNWVLVPELSSDDDDGDPELSRNGRTLLFTSDRDGDSDLYMSTRSCE